MHPDWLHILAQQRCRDIEEEIKRIHLSRDLGGRRRKLVVWFSRTIRQWLSGQESQPSGCSIVD